MFTKCKCVIVGDGSCGKSSLLHVLTDGEFPNHYIPTVIEDYACEFEIEDTHVELGLCSVAGHSEYDYIRALSYAKTDVVLVCFAVDCPSSLESVSTRWLPEVRAHCPTAPIVLIGNKTDLRSENNNASIDNRHKTVTLEEGKAMCKKIGANCYIECSAKMKTGVQNAFETAARLALGEKVSKKTYVKESCLIL